MTKEEWREYSARYREEHPEYVVRKNERMREYRLEIREQTPWLDYYRHAKERCNNPNWRRYDRYGGRGIKFLLDKEEVETLYKRDNADKLKHPSIDRIDNDGDYVFDNCRFIELSENSRKGSRGLNGS